MGPDRVPVMCEKSARTDLPDIEKKKFLVPGTMPLQEFKYIIHKTIRPQVHQDSGTAADKTIYLFVKGKSPKTGTLMSELYEEYKSEDGFMYMLYSAENT